MAMRICLIKSADDGLYLADGEVAPGEHLKEFTVTPQVTPVVALGVAGFEDEFHSDL